jgi:hypothetical protein
MNLSNLLRRIHQYPVAVRYTLWIVLGLVLGAIGGFVSALIGG